MVAFSTERLLLTLWVGSLWAIGFIAVPLAFANLADAVLAGNYAGKLFSVVNFLGLGCGTVILISKLVIYGKRVLVFWRFWIVSVMLILTLIFAFYLQPEIAVIKQIAWQDETVLSERFSLLHLISKNIYMVISLLGLALVLTTDNSFNQKSLSNGQK